MIIVDVRTREEYYENHIKGALNISVFDLEFYLDFLKEEEVFVYCAYGSGERAEMAVDYLSKNGIKAKMIPSIELSDYEWEHRDIICALNYFSVKPDSEEEIEDKMLELCGITSRMEGFLGSKIFRATNISYGGTGLRGEYSNIKIRPTKYIMLTYWTSKEAHEKFHQNQIIQDGFIELLKDIAIMPFEEYGEILR
jgi:heme-degrading monooxygenase HmoA